MSASKKINSIQFSPHSRNVSNSPCESRKIGSGKSSGICFLVSTLPIHKKRPMISWGGLESCPIKSLFGAQLIDLLAGTFSDIWSRHQTILKFFQISLSLDKTCTKQLQKHRVVNTTELKRGRCLSRQTKSHHHLFRRLFHSSTSHRLYKYSTKTIKYFISRKSSFMRKVSGLTSLQRNQKLVGKVAEVLCIKTIISSRRNSARFKVSAFINIYQRVSITKIVSVGSREIHIAPKV